MSIIIQEVIHMTLEKIEKQLIQENTKYKYATYQNCIVIIDEYGDIYI